MKIINRKDFLHLPEGVIYSKYESLGMISGLYKKHQSYTNDWVYQDYLGQVSAESDVEFTDIMFKAEEGNEFTIDFNCAERDGGYDDGDKFVIYDKTDLDMVILNLVNARNKYPIC